MGIHKYCALCSPWARIKNYVFGLARFTEFLITFSSSEQETTYRCVSLQACRCTLAHAHTCTRTQKNVCTHVQTHAQACMNTHTCMHAQTHTHRLSCMHEHMHACTCMKTHMHKHVCARAHTHKNMHTHTHIYILPFYCALQQLLMCLETWGPFKCYVTQMGVGVSDFPEKSVTKV